MSDARKHATVSPPRFDGFGEFDEASARSFPLIDSNSNKKKM